MNDSTHPQLSDAPPLDTVHSVLKDRRRRFVVDVLDGRQEPIDLTVLARAIALRLPDDADTGDQVDEIEFALHHVDLPKLDQADVVEYDTDAKVVVPTAVETFARFLDATASLQ